MGIQFTKGFKVYHQLPKINVWVLGDAWAYSITSSLRSEFAGQYNVQFRAVQMGTTYTGDLLTGSSAPDVVVYFTNSSEYGATTMSGNLRKFVNNGKGLVTATFAWSVNNVNFDKKLTPYTANAQSNTTATTYNKIISHPITDGVTTSLGSTTWLIQTMTTGSSLNTGAEDIANYGNTSTPLLGTWTSGSNNARLVGMNLYIGSNYLITHTTPRKLLARSILWAAKQI